VGLGALGARFRGVGSGSCRLGSVGGSGPGASGSVELREKAGSAGDRSGARFGRAGAWGGARFNKAPLCWFSPHWGFQGKFLVYNFRCVLGFSFYCAN
jgi:hypothetical protein